MNSGRPQFPDIMSNLEQDVNYLINSLFICIDYMLLKPRHISVRLYSPTIIRKE